MGLFRRGRKAAAFKAAPATTGSLVDPLRWQGQVVVPDPGIPIVSYASGDPWGVWRTQPGVRKVVDFIARNIASVPFNVYRRVSDTDRQRVTDHPVAQLLTEPGTGVTPMRLWHALLIDYLLYDRWCARILPSADTSSGWELLRVPAPRVRLVPDLWGRVTTVLVQSLDGKAIPLPPRGFAFDHGYDTEDPNGTPPIVTLSNLLAESAEAVEYRRQVWRNGARVPTVIERPADAPDWSRNGARDRFKASWQRFIRGGGQEGGTPVLEDGMKLVKSDAFSPRDTNDVEARQLTDVEVASAYHIAPELVGARQGTYSNVDAYRQMLYREALGPTIAAVEQVLNAMLLPVVAPGEQGLYIEANLESKLKGSFQEQAAILQTAVGGPYMLRSEARARMNLPAVDGADQLIVPLNVVEGGLASPRDTAPKAEPDRSGRKCSSSGRKSAPDDLAPFERERDGLAAALAGYQARQVTALLDRLGAKEPLPDLAALWGVDQADREAKLATLLAGWGLRLAQVGAWSVLNLFNPDAEGWSPDVMAAWLAKAAETHAHEIEQGGYDEAAGALAAGGDWRQGLQHALGVWAGRAATYAVGIATESHSFGAHDAAHASGLTTKTWHVHSHNPRPSHAALNGQTVSVDDVFGNGGRWPGDPNLDTDERANCSCSVTYGKET